MAHNKPKQHQQPRHRPPAPAPVTGLVKLLAALIFEDYRAELKDKKQTIATPGE